MSRTLPPVIIPAPDHARLERLARAAWSDQHPTARFLLSEIRRARVVDDSVSRDDIVTLNRWGTCRLRPGSLRRAGSWSIRTIMFLRSASYPCCLRSVLR